jgi:hypothetical protein
LFIVCSCDYIALNGRKISKKLSENDVERSSHNLISGNILAFPWTKQNNKNSAGIGVLQMKSEPGTS